MIWDASETIAHQKYSIYSISVWNVDDLSFNSCFPSYFAVMSRDIFWMQKSRDIFLDGNSIISNLSPETRISWRTHDPLASSVLLQGTSSTPLTSFCSTAHSSEKRPVESWWHRDISWHIMTCCDILWHIATYRLLVLGWLSCRSTALLNAVCLHLMYLDAFCIWYLRSQVCHSLWIHNFAWHSARRLLQGRLRSRAASTTWRPVMWSSWVRAQLRPPWWNLLPLCPHRWHDCNPFTKCGVLSLTCSVQRPMLGITRC